jgi:hypothetical protein
MSDELSGASNSGLTIITEGLGNMSENMKYQFQQSTNEELIDFVLEHLGQEHESARQLALQEHFLRTATTPDTIVAPSGDVQVLRSKLAQLFEAQSST